MNSINTKAFEVATADLPSAGAQEVETVLSKLMAAWEAKSARTAKRAAGLSLVAVSLAACNGSSSSSIAPVDPEEPTDPDEPGVTPVEGGVFTVLDFPTDTSGSGLFFSGANGLVAVDSVLATLTQVVNDLGLDGTLTTDTGETVTSADIEVIVDTVDNGSDVVINAGSSGTAEGFVDILDAVIAAGLLENVEQVEQVTTGRVILTPGYNSGEIVSDAGFGAGSQFEDGFFTSGVPAGGDDTIAFTRTELLHAAIVDGGGGADTVQIAAKGPYAQPTMLRSIETVEITHQANSSLSSLPDAIDPNDVNTAGVNATTFLLFDDAAEIFDANGTWIDLGTAFDIQTLKINETGNAGGPLVVIGVQNAATLELSDGFRNDVTVDYGANGGAVFDLVLRDVNFQSDAQLNVAQNSPTLRIESTGESASSENYLASGFFGPNLRMLEVSGDTFLNIDAPLVFNAGRETTIDAGGNTGGVHLQAANVGGGEDLDNDQIIVTGSQGDDHFTLEADALDITSGGGTNTYVLTGDYDATSIDGVVAAGRPGMLLTFDGTAGTNTIDLRSQVPAHPDDAFDVLLAGSSITGPNNALRIFDNYSLTEADISGVDTIAVELGNFVNITSAQATALGATAFSVIDAAENVASTAIGQPRTVNIVVQEDAALSDILDPTALAPEVKLGFRIPEGVTLTLTAEELHKYVAVNGITMGNDDSLFPVSVGNLVITDAGQNFDPSDTDAVDADGLPLVGGGTVAGADNNVTVERSDDGFERPSQDLLEDVFTIDSSAGPVVVMANDFGDDDEFTLPVATELVILGDNDVTFDAPVSFDGNTNFTIDFSELGGTLNGLEIVNFQNIADGSRDDWGAVIGNGGARIDVQLSGNLGNADNGLVSSGVATYVVTDITGDADGVGGLDAPNAEFWTSDPTEDLEVLGLQGNDGGTITFGNVRNGVNFLLEGDGFATFNDVPKALAPLDESNIGFLNAIFAPGSGTVTATVEINNQGVALGEASDGGTRTLDVDGINIDGAETVIVNVADGDASLGGVAGTDLENLTITSADDVTLTLDAGSADLETLDAGGVAGTMTLEVIDTGLVGIVDPTDPASTPADIAADRIDMSETDLTGIDAISMLDGSVLVLTSAQLDAIGAANIALEEGDTAVLAISVTDSAFDVSTIDPAGLPEGLTLALQIEPGVELTMTAEQFAALAEAGVTFTDGADPAEEEEPGSVNITGFNADSVAVDEEDGSALVDYGIVPASIAGTITFDGPIDLEIPGVYATGLDAYAFALEGGVIGIPTAAMANGLEVSNGDVDFNFLTYAMETVGGDPDAVPPVPGTPGVDASGYTDIGKVTVADDFRSDALGSEFNVESIAFLDPATEVEVVPFAVNVLSGINQVAVVGGVPIDDPTADPAPVVDPSLTLVFDNITGDPEQNVQTVDILFEVGGNQINDIVIGAGADVVDPGDVKPLFQTLAITSNGDAANTVDDIFAQAGNDLLDVLIVANEAFVAQTIFVSSEADDATATVTISGASDVTLKGIDSSDPEVDTLVIDTAGYTGTLTLTGGSDSLELDGTETVTFTGDGTVTLDTAEEVAPGDDFDGIDGGGDLTAVDAAAQVGALTLGVIKNVGDGFTLTGGTGVITGAVEGLPANYLIDLSTAADGSAIDLGDVTLTAGTLELATDPDTFETTLTFGDGASLTVDGDFDLGAFTNVEFGTGVELVLGEDGVVSMEDDVFAAFETAGGTITGDTEKLFGDTDPAIARDDLSDVRGLTQIDLEEGTGPYTLTSEQVEIARPGTVDGDGVFTPTAENGDFTALKADPGLTVEVKAGDTFEVTDVDANNLTIKGDGSVNVTMEGTKGAELTVAAGADNNAGQSITVNYTLAGEAGSVTVNNTAVDFTDAGAVATALSTALDAVDGLEASAAGGVVEFGADEPGVDFVLGDITVTDGGSGIAVTGESTTASAADMSGNDVVDTTHIFPAIATGFYVLTGTLGGAANADGELTVTLQTEGNFINAEGVNIPLALPEDTEIVLSGAPEVKLANGFLDGTSVTGDGSVQVENATTAQFAPVELPVEVTLSADTIFDGSFNAAQPLTVTDNDPDTERTLSIVGADGLPASIALTGTRVILTADQANGLTITGGSTALVFLDPDGNEDLSGIAVDLVLQGAGGGSTFGGSLPATDVEIRGDIELRETGTSIPAGTSFSVGAFNTLTLSAAQADGLSITGILDVDDIDDDDDTTEVLSAGSVVVTNPTGAEDLSGIDLPVTFDITDAEATELTLPASTLAGETVTIAGGDPAEAFTLTVSEFEGALDGDFSAVTVTAGASSTAVFELDSSGDVAIAFNANFGIGVSGDASLVISGDGTVTVADGATGDDVDADLTALDSIEIGAGATLEVDDTVAGSNAVDRSIVEGDGTLVRTGFEAGDSVDAGGTNDVALQVFAFGDDDFAADGAVQLGAAGTEFVNGGDDDPTDAMDLNAILDVTGVSDGINVAGLGTGNEDQVILLLADAGADVNTAANVVTAFDGATAGSTAIGAADAENFLVLFNDDGGAGDTGVWLWQDGVDADGGAVNVASDGVVGESELTQVASLETEDNTPLSSDNFVI